MPDRPTRQQSIPTRPGPFQSTPRPGPHAAIRSGNIKLIHFYETDGLRFDGMSEQGTYPTSAGHHDTHRHAGSPTVHGARVT